MNQYTKPIQELRPLRVITKWGAIEKSLCNIGIAILEKIIIT